MTSTTRPTTFVTGATGFLGMELVQALRLRGHQVCGLAESPQQADRLRRLGATPVLGDLQVPGQWQDEAVADWVFHLPPPRIDPVPFAANATAALARAVMDNHLLQAAATATTRRIIYVADAGWYGSTGPRPITEDEAPRRSPSHLMMTAGLARLDGYVMAGFPIVTVFPSRIYGNGSWFRECVVDPILAGRRVLRFGATSPRVSAIHVKDCARALVHLAEHGRVGGRYFAVNSESVREQDFAETCARLAGRQLRVWRLPAIAAPMARWLASPHARADAVFSNIRLRGSGFRFEYPTLEEGIQHVLEHLYEHPTV